MACQQVVAPDRESWAVTVPVGAARGITRSVPLPLTWICALPATPAWSLTWAMPSGVLVLVLYWNCLALPFQQGLLLQRPPAGMSACEISVVPS